MRKKIKIYFNGMILYIYILLWYDILWKKKSSHLKYIHILYYKETLVLIFNISNLMIVPSFFIIYFIKKLNYFVIK